jgi:hypothetical protein
MHSSIYGCGTDLVREQASRRAGVGILPRPTRAVIMRREDDLGVSNPCRPIAVRPIHNVTLLLQHMQQCTPVRVPNAARRVLGRAQDASASICGANARHLPCVTLENQSRRLSTCSNSRCSVSLSLFCGPVPPSLEHVCIRKQLREQICAKTVRHDLECEAQHLQHRPRTPSRSRQRAP